MKFLVSITPNWIISFVFRGYGGLALDLYITEDCEFVECMPNGATIIANRGFKVVATLLARKSCSLVRPARVSMTNLSSEDDVVSSRKIASI